MHIRKSLLNQRKALLPAEQHKLSSLINERAKQLEVFEDAQYIAFYQAIYGEVNCKELIESAWKRKKTVFLPILSGPKLKFIHYEPHQPLIKNHYGIEEPIATPQNTYHVMGLDLVFAPLVAFDIQMNRMGMGKGYYDKTFDFLKNRKTSQKPCLVGLAYEFQKVEQLHPEVWDIPLDMVITEKQVY